MNTRIFLIAGWIFFLPPFLLSQLPIRYHVSLDNAEHHELYVTVEFPSLSPEVLQVRMPQSSPGRYAEHNFAKNVYDVRAFDRQGQALTVYRSGPSQWDVTGHNGYVRFQYTLYGNHADGTYTGVNNRMAHMNMPATFVYGVDMQERPIQLSLGLSRRPGWRVATQLHPLNDSTYVAPDYYYFYDSPTIIGDLDYRSWTSRSDNRDYTIEIAMLHTGTEEELDRYVEWTRRIVEEQKAVFGELPAFDFGRYTFLCSYNPWVHGDGMEHRNSTVCSARAGLADNARGLIGTVSHEFFHCWNVERLRPQSLEPFDFDEANMSGELWFAEGFTSYYGDLILCRTGITPPEDYIRGLDGTLNYVINSPGRMHRSPVEMSRNAPFVDAASAIDENNFSNTFVSYYPYGAVIALTLDLTLRSRFEGVTLDDYMRELWSRYGKTEVPYQIPDLERTLADVTGDAEFAAIFFRESVYGSELPDLAPLLARMGIILRRPRETKTGFPGLNLAYNAEEGGAVVQSPVLETNPLYAAGLTRGDRILALAGRPLAGPDDLQAVVDSLVPGKQYPVKYVQNNLEQSGTFIAAPDPTLEILPDENATAEALERRKEWLKQ